MLSAKIMDTIDIIEKAQKAQKIKNKVNKYRNLESSIKRVNKQLENYKNMFLIIKDYNSKITTEPSFEDLIKKVDEALVKLNNREMSGNFHLGSISIIKTNEEELKENWFQHIREVISNLNNTLQMLENLYDNSNEIKKLRINIKRMEDKWPFTEMELDYFRRTVKESKEIIESLDVSDNIKDFLIKVSQRQASVLDLSDEILGWLNKHNFMDKLMIRFKSSNVI